MPNMNGGCLCEDIRCSAAIWIGSRIASAENVPQTSSVASPPLFPLPH